MPWTPTGCETLDRPRASVMSLTDMALGKSCLLANTSRATPLSSSSSSCNNNKKKPPGEFNRKAGGRLQVQISTNRWLRLLKLFSLIYRTERCPTCGGNKRSSPKLTLNHFDDIQNKSPSLVLLQQVQYYYYRNGFNRRWAGYHRVQLVSGFFNPLGVVAVDHKYQTLNTETDGQKQTLLQMSSIQLFGESFSRNSSRSNSSSITCVLV